MSNMSYCRFQNTLRDLQDCNAAFEDEEHLSKDEMDAAFDLVELCAAIVERFPGGFKNPPKRKG